MLPGSEFLHGQGPSNYVNLRETYDMIDTTTLANRSMRYKEYERLRNVPEIEGAMNVGMDVIYFNEFKNPIDLNIPNVFHLSEIKQYL